MRNLFKYICIALVFTGVISCEDATRLEHLEGYWEIEKADLPGADTKEYSISTILDHYVLETDSSGFKTKVSPKLDGSFQTSGHRERFTIAQKDGKVVLHYRTPLTDYTETVVRLKAEQLILINDRDMKYTYKRFKKLELE